jgi:hypothetical protein
VMLGWPRQAQNRRGYVRMIRDLLTLDRNLLLIHDKPDRGLGERKQIHIWWGGLRGNGGLMLLLAHLLQASDDWRGAEVTLLTVVDNEKQRERAEATKVQIIEDARISARTRVLLRQDRPIAEIMATESGDADLAILGIGLPASDDEAELFFDRVNRMLKRMPTTLLVHSARTFQGEPVLFEMEE